MRWKAGFAYGLKRDGEAVFECGIPGGVHVGLEWVGVGGVCGSEILLHCLPNAVGGLGGFLELRYLKIAPRDEERRLGLGESLVEAQLIEDEGLLHDLNS